MILKILAVIGLSTFEIYLAITAGLVAGLSKITILLCTLSGGIMGVFIAAFLGKKIEHWLLQFRNKPAKPKNTSTLIYKIWNKYGIVGLSLVGTFLFGAPIAMGVGVGFNAPLQKMVPLCLIAVVIRCFTFTYLGNSIRGLF